jgi:putative copper export protein
VLFLAMVVLAAANRFRLMPQIAHDLDPATPLWVLARAVLAEQALGLAILAVVSVLGTWPPAIYFGHP